MFGAMVSPEMAKAGLDRPHFEKLAGIPAGKAKPAKLAKKGGT